jgi:beta-glucuronidase
MLRPQDTSTSERKSLNGLWEFRLDPEDEGQSAGWFSRPLPDSRQMAVPASFNDIAADATVRDYFGDMWYQTSVWVPRS